MRRAILMLPVLLLCGACQRYEGPREVYQRNRAGDRADLPGYTLSEQKARGRERYTYIEDNTSLPKAWVDGPGGVGR